VSDVSPFIREVLRAIQLDRKAPYDLEEVEDVRAELVLTAELRAVETAAAEHCPEPPLLVGRRLTQAPSQLGVGRTMAAAVVRPRHRPDQTIDA
jgi:hypothetical protein